ASPTYFRIEAAFHGKAAHAGIRPEEGRSSIVAAARAVTSLRLGRLDEETTANVGSIEGGTGGTNVVPEHARFLAEARSIDDANGTERNHEPTERVSVAALESMLDVTFALLEAAAEQP